MEPGMRQKFVAGNWKMRKRTYLATTKPAAWQ